MTPLAVPSTNGQTPSRLPIPTPPPAAAPAPTVQHATAYPLDFLEMIAEAAILKFLTKLPPGYPPHVLTVRTEYQGTAAILRFGSPAEVNKVEHPALPTDPHHDLSPCERAALKIVLDQSARTRRRIKTDEIFTVMQGSGETWSKSTLLKALAMLVGCGYIVNHHDKRGYGPPETEGGAA